MTKFTIIVPTYNNENTLEKCVMSLLAQTYGNFEVILINDGSTDRTPAMCDAFAARDLRIKVIHQANGGVNSARKTGANAAIGGYVVCVDADDWLEATCLEFFARILEQHMPDVICCEHYKTDGVARTHKKLPFDEGLYQKSDIESKLYSVLIEDIDGHYFPPTLWAKAIRRDLFVQQQNAVDDRIRIGEDGAIVKPCIYYANTVYLLKNPLYYYYENMSSATRSRRAFSWDGPRLRGAHFEKQLPMDVADFQDQVYRMVVHALFNVAESQFNRNEKYGVIAKEIKENLQDPYYQRAIKHCKFSGKKGKLALFALKHKAILLIKLFNSFKYR